MTVAVEEASSIRDLRRSNVPVVDVLAAEEGGRGVSVVETAVR